jgi:hypothetical protein
LLQTTPASFIMFIPIIIYLILFFLVVYLILSTIKFMRRKIEHQKEFLNKFERLLTIMEGKYGQNKDT